MAEYIDRNKLLKNSRLYEHEEYTGISEKPFDYITCISVEDVRKTPTENVASVIFCKDCKHYKKVNIDDKHPTMCEITTMLMGRYGYCSKGAKMDGDKDE